MPTKPKLTTNGSYEDKKKGYYFKCSKQARISRKYSSSDCGIHSNELRLKRNCKYKICNTQFPHLLNYKSVDSQREIDANVKKRADLSDKVSSNSTKTVYIQQHHDDNTNRTKHSTFISDDYYKRALKSIIKKNYKNVKKNVPKFLNADEKVLTCPVCNNRQLHANCKLITAINVENSLSMEQLLKQLNSDEEITRDLSEGEWLRNKYEYSVINDPSCGEKMSPSGSFSMSSVVCGKAKRSLSRVALKKDKHKLKKKKILVTNGRITKRSTFGNEMHYENGADVCCNRMINNEYAIPLVIRRSVADDDDTDYFD